MRASPNEEWSLIFQRSDRIGINALLAVVKRELFSFIHHRFTVDVPGPDDLEAEGDFLDHEYTFTRGDRVVATVSKRWFSWTDTYGIAIADGDDAPEKAIILMVEGAGIVPTGD